MKKMIKPAFIATIPVLTGYLVLGFGFGIIMKANGYGIMLAFAMSLLIYAGSMQYVAVGLMTSGASLITVALTTLMVNARHLFYGISMIDKFNQSYWVIFVIFNGNKKTPVIIEKLGRVLPFAIMGMLVVYCFKEVTFTSIAGFLPQLIACLVVGILYVWKRNTLISIVCGTICYMILVQMVF